MERLVTPLVGVWIEIIPVIKEYGSVSVTPLVGVWIEIQTMDYKGAILTSLPLWECGLKYELT